MTVKWRNISVEVTKYGISSMFIEERDKTEFRVEMAEDNNSLCVDCSERIKRGERRVRIFKRQISLSKKADCFYHVKCFVSIHKDVFKDMCVDIVNGALMVE